MPRISQRRFFRDLVVVFALLAAMVAGAAAYFSVRARQDITQKTIDNATSSAVRQFRAMADAMTQSLELVGDWVGSGRASLADTAELNRLLFPLLKRTPILFGVSIADTQGNSYYLSVHGNGWRTAETSQSSGVRQTAVRFWDADQLPISVDTKTTTYDARSRPWFSPVLSGEGMFWTLPYKFYNRDAVGITASIAKKDPSGSQQTVVAFDILLGDLFAQIQQMAPSENARVFIFRNDTQLYLPDADGVADFRSLTQIRDPLIRKMMTAWDGSVSASNKAFAIRQDNAVWWCGFQPMEGANRNVWMGVMVPETDILGSVNQRQVGLWTMGGVILLLVGGLALFMARRYARLGHVNEDTYDGDHPEQSIRRLIAKGEGRTIEFKSTMRMNLHTNKPGKEIELAWLKAVTAFMNTDGGILLLGVADDGTIAGLEADGFANEDKCRLHFKNLVNQHIGAEFSRYLQFHHVCVEGKQVGVVSCRRSIEPVYLKTGKAEEFYIRSGPSSDALPVSKVVAYIQSRT